MEGTKGAKLLFFIMSIVHASIQSNVSHFQLRRNKNTFLPRQLNFKKLEANMLNQLNRKITNS